ncbi:Na+/H+ antiporter subunit E [Sabulicella rubraurantiaca]|uniref:Na+/H+ antiporter subunit E n=1 Tax=Sabulicella rubraurantiaca TaxID=2811429 RepID=UPI001A97B2EB|nr:Na+/H+ antiporter subunit E [Sabulicella rubraurantiaca]
MRRILPHPLAALALLIAWLLLVGDFSPGSLILGVVIAILGSWLLREVQPPRLRLRRFGVLFELVRVVLVEIVRSNFAVARIVLAPRPRAISSGFVRIPLEMRDPIGLTALAFIITATPGTVWVEYDSADDSMLLHVLDLIDEAEWVGIIKNRYERRLMEILT